MILKQLSQHLTVLLFVLWRQNLGKSIEDVKGLDVEFVYSQNCWIAADNEGQRANAGDAVCNSDGKLSVKILRASL